MGFLIEIKNVYHIALAHEFREMALTFFGLLFYKKETAASMPILTLHWHLIA